MDTAEILVIYLIPLIFIFGGIVMWKLTPKKNFLVGWRTRLAMKSEENFKIANERGGKAMFYLGLVELAVSVIITMFSRFITTPEWTTLYVISVQTIALFAIIIAVERQLKNILK